MSLNAFSLKLYIEHRIAASVSFHVWVGDICMGYDRLAGLCTGDVDCSLSVGVCGAGLFCCLLWLFGWG